MIVAISIYCLSPVKPRNESHEISSDDSREHENARNFYTIQLHLSRRNRPTTFLTQTFWSRRTSKPRLKPTPENGQGLGMATTLASALSGSHQSTLELQDE
jgi:hypothetical protein